MLPLCYAAPHSTSVEYGRRELLSSRAVVDHQINVIPKSEEQTTFSRESTLRMKVAKLIKQTTDLNKLKLTHSTMDIVLAQRPRVRFSASGFRFNDSAAP